MLFYIIAYKIVLAAVERETENKAPKVKISNLCNWMKYLVT